MTKFLIVDDDAVFRAWLRGLLQRHFACSVSEAVNGLAAWAMLASEKASSPVPVQNDAAPLTAKRETFDLCFIDAMMPGMDGPTLLGKLRADERLRAMKVIFCSASGNRQIVVKVAVHRVDGYLVKPLDAHTLVGLVRKCLPGVSGTGLRTELDEMCSRLDLKKDVCLRSIGELIGQVQKSLTTTRAALVARDYGRARLVCRELDVASDRLEMQVLSKPLARLVGLLEELALTSSDSMTPHSKLDPFPPSYGLILETIDQVGLENFRLLADLESITQELKASPEVALAQSGSSPASALFPG